MICPRLLDEQPLQTTASQHVDDSYELQGAHTAPTNPSRRRSPPEKSRYFEIHNTRNSIGGVGAPSPPIIPVRTPTSVMLARLNLSSDILAFIDIPINQFRAIMTFLSERPEFFRVTQSTVFEDAATEAIVKGDFVLMQQCIQRRVIGVQCAKPTGYDPEYLVRLIEKDERVSRHFYDSVNRLIATTKARAAEEQSMNPTVNHPPAVSYPHRNSAQHNAGQTEGASYGPRYPVTPGPFNTLGYNQHGTSQADSSVSAFHSTSPPYVSAAGYRPAGTYTAVRVPGDTGGGTGPFGHKDEDLRSTSPTINEGPRYRPIGTATTSKQGSGPEPPLDPKYKVQNGKNFFTKGKVFAMVFSEPRGVNPATRNKQPNDSGYSIKDSHEETVFTRRRVFVVVRQRRGHCLCVPISTYGNSGVGRLGIHREEKVAHAIIYDGSKAPPKPILPGEEAMTKRPIAVDMYSNHTLADTSRIHFGKTYTIEWNVKVMPMGKIARQSEQDFEGYFVAEFLNEER